MANEGRFLNKRFTIADGFARGPSGPAVYFDDNGNANVEGSVNVQDITGSGAVLDSVKLKAGHKVSAWWSVAATWNMGAIVGVYGSTNSVIVTDVAMSGAAIGDLVQVAPIGSLDTSIFMAAVCSSANSINVRAIATGSTANTPGNVPIKITALKLT